MMTTMVGGDDDGDGDADGDDDAGTCATVCRRRSTVLFGKNQCFTEAFAELKASTKGKQHKARTSNNTCALSPDGSQSGRAIHSNLKPNKLDFKC